MVNARPSASVGRGGRGGDGRDLTGGRAEGGMRGAMTLAAAAKGCTTEAAGIKVDGAGMKAEEA